MLSNLSPKLKTKLDEQRTISMGLKKYLRLEEQVSHLITLYRILHSKTFYYCSKEKPGFNVDDFSREHGLLKFAFVRHPFDRYAPML